MELQVGSILEGKVTSITKFGAFVALDNGKSGLVPISEIANTFVNDVHDYLQEGQAVKVLVLSTENGKVNLSIFVRSELLGAIGPLHRFDLEYSVGDYLGGIVGIHLDEL